MDKQTTKYYSRLCNAASGIAFIIALATYWATADSGVSYWDCPEYVTCASRLEVGHPPGNPIWMLAMRAATIPFPAATHAYVINLCSGLFMALATLFLTRLAFMLVVYVGRHYLGQHSRISAGGLGTIAAASSLCGGLCFAWCDSAWFSAVEAEVYAMSAFLSALVIWLMTLWASADDPSRRGRLLILIAYITGLSLGVHQLNLLCIPVLAIIYVFARHRQKGCTARAWGAILLSFAAIALILIGMMNGTLAWGAGFELFAVNTLHLPFFSGITAYAAATLLSLACAVFFLSKKRKLPAATALFIFIWLSGIVVFKGNLAIGGLISAVVAAGAIYAPRLPRKTVLTATWMLGFILLGYSSFAIILIRGCASPPMNEGAPTDIFALTRYIARDQYGSKPLLYGATPYSAPMVVENLKPGTGRPDYSRYILKKKSPQYVVALPGARLHHRSGFVTGKDSADNSRTAKSHSDGYILSDYSFSRVTSPELDMWFPRITGSSPSMIESYESWAGMDKASMTHVEISSTVDSLGNPAGKIDASGKRHRETSWRPTYMQNLRMLLSYQTGYMYFRYLLWNFAGRQNDIPSTGEIDHGNFITGFRPIDDAMLGDSTLVPENAGKGNPGRNVYFCLPLIFGIAGFVFLARSGKRGRRALAVTAVFFLMTGLAIVVYLNQTPGEPRERDYSFLGSFMAFAIWIAFGVAATAIAVFKRSRSAAPRLIVLLAAATGLPLIMAVENLDDHDRSGRFETATYASNILSMRPEGIIFTHGDNFTFPLWYAQEVENAGKGHTVVDISYLATPEYVVNLMKQGKNGIRFTATPADVAYGAYAFTRIAKDADATPVPLIEALKELYSQKEGAPEFKHSRVTVAGLTPSDTLTINLRDMTTGGTIPFKQLMLLDILASNLNDSTQRPLYFLSHIAKSFYKPLAEATRPFAFAEIYAPAMTESSYLCNLSNLLDTLKQSEGPTKRKPAYIDPVTADMSRRQRGTLTRMARTFLDNGNVRKAKECAETAINKFPFDVIPGASFTVADSTFHEGIELARLLIDLGKTSGNRKIADRAATLLRQMRKTAKQWQKYYASLSPGRRTLVSNETRRLILTIPAIDSLLNDPTINQRLRHAPDSLSVRPKPENL